MTSLASPPVSGNAPCFRVGYDGASDYTWRSQRWICRHHQAQTIKPECQAESDRTIGTVSGDNTRNRHEFPPLELMAHFPGFTRAAYRPTGETYTVETSCGPITVDRCKWEFEETPRVEQTPLGLRAVAWREAMEAAGVDVS